MLNTDIELIHEGCGKNAVMLFHGLTGSPWELRKYARFLFDNGYDVYCYTLPGHGNHRIDIYNVKLKDWTDFVCEKYRSLRGYYNNFFVGGLCLGAVLALYLAQKYKTISGLICLSTTLFLDGSTIPKYNFLLPVGLNTVLKYYYTFEEREPYGIKNVFTRRKIAKLMSKNTVALDNYPLSAIGELLKLSKEVRNKINKVKAPIIAVHSKEDDLTSVRSADFVYEKTESAIKEKVILNNSYHLILYDNEKEYVYEKTLSFLEKIRGYGFNYIQFNRKEAVIL